MANEGDPKRMDPTVSKLLFAAGVILADRAARWAQEHGPEIQKGVEEIRKSIVQRLRRS